MTSPAIDALVAARTGSWTEDERAALARVIAALRPSARHLTDVLDWLDDIGVRDGHRPGELLATPELARLLDARGSAPDRLKRWKETLRRLRYPRLVAREAEAAALIRAMALGPDVEVGLPAALEGGALRITITAASAETLAAALGRLDAGVRGGAMATLFGLLDEL